METSESLCLACGLCCDGSLFDNVQFGAEEDAGRLVAQGLPVKRSRAKAPTRFVCQPCPALQKDCRCRVYSDRPRQCRSFECGVYKDFLSGRLDFKRALRWVAQARRMSSKARVLLRRLGEEDEGLSLSKRFRRVRRWVDAGLLDADSGAVYGELGLILHQLDLLAHRHFYTVEE